VLASTLGANHPDTLTAMERLGDLWARDTLKRRHWPPETCKKGAALWNEVLRLRTTANGGAGGGENADNRLPRDPVGVARALRNLSVFTGSEGNAQLDEARRLLEATDPSVDGRDPELGRLYLRLGANRRGEDLLDRALPLLPLDDPDRLDCQLAVAARCVEVQHYGIAEGIYREVLDGLRR
jgi:hypothetical protein